MTDTVPADPDRKRRTCLAERCVADARTIEKCESPSQEQPD